MLSYEPAKAEDLELLYALNKQLIDKYEDTAAVDYPKVLDWVRRNLEQTLPSFTRVFRDGELAGFYCLTPSDGTWELDSLFVLEPYQGQGIGTEIHKRCPARSPSLILYVFRRNVRAIALYERMGFRIVKEEGKTRYIMAC